MRCVGGYGRGGLSAAHAHQRRYHSVAAVVYGPDAARGANVEHVEVGVVLLPVLVADHLDLLRVAAREADELRHAVHDGPHFRAGVMRQPRTVIGAAGPDRVAAVACDARLLELPGGQGNHVRALGGGEEFHERLRHRRPAQHRVALGGVVRIAHPLARGARRDHVRVDQREEGGPGELARRRRRERRGRRRREVRVPIPAQVLDQLRGQGLGQGRLAVGGAHWWWSVVRGLSLA